METTIAKKYNIAEAFEIKDLDTLKKLTHPQRIDILQSLTTPQTVKEVAAKIDADPTKLYYHIRQMEKVGVIQVVETNIVSGIVEKKYLVTAKEYRVDKDLFSGQDSEASDEDITNMFGAIFNSTLKQAKRASKAGLIELNETGAIQTTAIMSGTYCFTESQLKEFGKRMAEMMEEFKTMSEQNQSAAFPDGNPEAKEYLYTLAFFPRPPSETE